VVSTDLITDDGSKFNFCQFNSGDRIISRQNLFGRCRYLRNSFIFAISASYDSMEPDEIGVLILIQSHQALFFSFLLPAPPHLQ
jgi:hypothetical protein